MRDFSQRAGLISLLSCPAPGRPPHLEGEAARPYLVTTETKPKDRASSPTPKGSTGAAEIATANFGEQPFYALGCIRFVASPFLGVPSGGRAPVRWRTHGPKAAQGCTLRPMTPPWRAATMSV